MYAFQSHYRSPSDPTQSPRQPPQTVPAPRPIVLDWPPPSLEKPQSRFQRMMAPTKTKLSKITTRETKEYVGFTPSGRGVKVTAGRVDEVYGGKGDVPEPTITSRLNHFPHPDQKPLPEEPHEQLLSGGMGDLGLGQDDLQDMENQEGNPEYTPSARAKVLPWVTEMQQTPPSQSGHQTTLPGSTQYVTAPNTGAGASHHDPLSAAEYARADDHGHVPGPGFMERPKGLGKRDTWLEEQSLERERLAREYEGENSFERQTRGSSRGREGGNERAGDEEVGEDEDDEGASEADSLSKERQLSGKEDVDKPTREKRKHRHHKHKDGRHRHHRHGGDKNLKPKSKPRTNKLSKGTEELNGTSADTRAPTQTQTRTGESPGLASDAMSRGAMPPGQGQTGGGTMHGDGLGMSGFAPDQPGLGGFNNVPRNPGDLHPPLPVGLGSGLGLGVEGVPWGQAGQTRSMDPSFSQQYGPFDPPEPVSDAQARGFADQYHQGYYHPGQNPNPTAFPYGPQFQGTNQPAVFPVSMPQGENPAFKSAHPPNPILAPATDPSVVQREQEQAIEAHLADLQERMLRSAEESRQALAVQKEERERDEARRDALNLLGGTRTGKDSRSPASVKSGTSRKTQPQGGYPPEAKYVHTNAGNIKTYEEIRKMSSKSSTTGGSETMDKESSRKAEREPKRKTKETFVTDTTGPSFGHFGRPFSHEILGGGMHGHRDIMEEEEFISPMGGGAPIIVMRRVAHEEGAPLGSGLGGMFGRHGPHRDQRSAYVETVVDEESPLSPRARGDMTNGISRTSSPVHQPTQAPLSSSGRSTRFESPARRTNKGSDSSEQGSAVVNKPVPPLPVDYASVPQPRPQLRPPLSSNPANRMSTATTTMSLVNQIVTDSRFHDDALCDLLRAARDDSLGDAAKKAVRRAARERVMELTGMRQKYPGKADSEKTVTPAPEDRSGRSSSDLDDEEPPAWSRALFEMLEHTNARLDALDHRMSSGTQTGASESMDAGDADEEIAARAALHNLLFPDLPMDIPLFGSGPYATPPRSQFRADQAHISDLRTEERTVRQLPDWGSSVDIPDGSSVPAMRPEMIHPISGLGPAIAPTIKIQPPTAHASTAGGPKSHVTHISPRSSPKGPLDDARSTGGASRKTEASRYRDHHSPASVKSAVRVAPAKSESAHATTEGDYEDPLLPTLPSPRPWDVVTQRLFSWALVWPPEDFVRSLETTALGQQVDEFALTIYMMTIFKRNLRHRMCSGPPLPCDKLFVPPNLADSINRAVHSKRFADAKQILEELWYPFGFKEPPRVIVALAKHRNDANHWSAHRFDLTSGKLVTFSYSTEEKSLVDGRPFMWWFPIRDAWQTWNVPHPDHLTQKTQRVITPESSKEDNALMAANCARNLLLGWKPDQTTDLKKMRNNIWNETKRLYERKAKGKLAVDSKDY